MPCVGTRRVTAQHQTSYC